MDDSGDVLISVRLAGPFERKDAKLNPRIISAQLFADIAGECGDAAFSRGASTDKSDTPRLGFAFAIRK